MSAPHGRPHYRPDIDGLRALAVLSVIIFHIKDSLLPGGFVGVDVFFVISGYLITYNIVSEIDGNRFSIVDFYRRRIRRIAPAMIVVVACTVFLAQILTIPGDAERTAESAVWSLFSLANVYFWLFEDQGYFAQDIKEIPLLHLWSLGVEEQFYLVWPVVLLLLLPRIQAKWFIPILTVIGLGSYLMGEILFGWSPSFVYYMIPTRAGELLTGAVVAITFARGYNLKLSKPRAELLGMIGLGLILASFVLLSEHQVFPGVRAIPPTLGVALVILAGQGPRNRVTESLAVSPLVWVGLVSYSAYLWHWPLLAFIRYGFGEVRPALAVVALVITFFLAAVTYRFVEKPARRTKWTIMKVFCGFFLVPAGAISCFCLLIMVSDGMAARPAAESFEVMRPAYDYDYVCQKWLISSNDLKDPRCIVGAGSSTSPDAILWGDSNAAHYIGVLGAFADAAGFRFRNVQHASCPPLLDDPSPFIDADRRADCVASLEAVMPTIRASTTLFISASWPSYQRRDPTFLAEVFRGAEKLVADGKRVVLIGKAPVFSRYDRKCLEKLTIYPFIDCDYASIPVANSIPSINALLAEFAHHTEGVEYFDVMAIICPGQLCSPFDENGQGLYFDSEHISMDGSWRIGRRYIEEFGVPAIFASLGHKDMVVDRP